MSTAFSEFLEMRFRSAAAMARGAVCISVPREGEAKEKFLERRGIPRERAVAVVIYNYIYAALVTEIIVLGNFLALR